MFDRQKTKFRPLGERVNRVDVETGLILPDAPYVPLTPEKEEAVTEVAAAIRAAKARGAARVLTFGAHAIKNGLGPMMARFIEEGWLTHLATNGAGIIHDWELAYLGATSEHVAENVRKGEFGAWEETGFYLNLAINVGAYRGLGYGESIGALVEKDGLEIPAREELEGVIREGKKPAERAAAADLVGVLETFKIEPGWMAVAHPHKQAGLQAAAYRLPVPYTAHPGFGQDIIYEHPMSLGAAVGRTAERDFLSFVGSVSELQGGVYLSLGSAVMSPMIFEKSLNMARNAALPLGQTIDDVRVFVVDLGESTWDWQQGEPPETNPAYYMRFNKTFSRMGCRTAYLALDNRQFIPALYEKLRGG